MTDTSVLPHTGRLSTSGLIKHLGPVVVMERLMVQARLVGGGLQEVPC